MRATHNQLTSGVLAYQLLNVPQASIHIQQMKDLQMLCYRYYMIPPLRLQEIQFHQSSAHLLMCAFRRILTPDQQLSRKYEDTGIDLKAYARSVFDPKKRFNEIADFGPYPVRCLLYTTICFLMDPMCFGITQELFMLKDQLLRFSGKHYVGQDDVYNTLSVIRRKLAGPRPQEKIVHVVEKLHCRPHSQDGLVIRASGFFILGSSFLVCGNGVQAEGMLSIQEIFPEFSNKRVGTFYEQFVMEPGPGIGCFSIVSQDLHILQS